MPGERLRLRLVLLMVLLLMVLRRRHLLVSLCGACLLVPLTELLLFVPLNRLRLSALWLLFWPVTVRPVQGFARPWRKGLWLRSLPLRLLPGLRSI